MDLKKLTANSNQSSLKIDDEFIVVSASKEYRLKFEQLSSEIDKYESVSSEKGARGEQGDKGMYGIRGEFGFPGDYGEPGLKGFKGAKGNKGNQGIKGFRGQSGYNGEPGEPGVNASDGQKGLKGSNGVKGGPGEKGSSGDKGIKGSRGFPGTNKIGKPGDVGVPGEKITGKTGYKGYKGKSSTKKGQKGDRGETGRRYDYPDVRRSFKRTDKSPYQHSRMLAFLFSLNSSNSIAVTSNDVLMEQLRNRRFLVFDLVQTSNIISERYSSLLVEIDFEPFITNGHSPVLTKSGAVYCKNGTDVGVIGFDWYKDSSSDYHISFFGVFNTTDQTIQLPVKTIYSFTSLHLKEVVGGEIENLRI